MYGNTGTERIISVVVTFDFFKQYWKMLKLGSVVEDTSILPVKIDPCFSREGQHSGSYVEVVTGKGNRSEHGKSRLRPAVVNWLEQKKYRYSEVNPGALKIYLKGG